MALKKPSRLTILLFLFSLIFCGSISCFGQSVSFKLGQVTDIELQDTFKQELEAYAIVLADYGEAHIGTPYGFENGFRLFYKRYLRVKILGLAGMDYATVEIPLYRSGTTTEKVLSLKATSNELVNGKPFAYKLEKKDIYDERQNENWSVKKFTMPKVKEGTIIEVSYTVESPFISSIDDWYFQKGIPVLESYFSLRVPDWLRYKMRSIQYLPFTDEKFERRPVQFYTGTPSEVTYNELRYSWKMQDIPQYEEEPYSKSRNANLSRLSFEVYAIEIPDQPTQSFSQTWQEVVDRHLERYPINGKLICEEDQVDAWSLIIDEEERAKSIFNYVQRSTDWNGVTSVFSDKRKGTWCESQKGNVGDINTYLLHLLKACKIDANPVMISTRTHGPIYTSQPSSSVFNKLIVEVKAADKRILLDASNDFLEPGQLSLNDLNGQGYRFSKVDHGWVDLLAGAKYVHQVQANLSIADHGGLALEWKGRHSGYAGYEIKRLQHLETSIEQLGAWEFLSEAAVRLDTLSFDFKGDKVNSVGSASLPAPLEVDGQLIIPCSPFNYLGEHPFKAKERLYSIDFVHPSSMTYMLSFEIPDGYVVETLPEAKVLMLPDKGLQLTFQVSQLGNNVNITSIFTVRRIEYTVNEYESLQQFFTSMENYLNQAIILKRE